MTIKRSLSRPASVIALACTVTLACALPAQARSERIPAARAHELYSKDQLSQNLAPCAGHFPGNAPLRLEIFARERQVTGLCSNSFAVIASRQTKTPMVVVERLSTATIADAQDEDRTDIFFPHPRLKASERASLNDFKGSGFDRGHLSPAANQPDPISMAQSFALSNIVPQDPTNNRRTWAKIESDVRKYVLRAKGGVYVFSGPLFDATSIAEQPTIGRNKVWVPSHLFKLVYDETSGRAWAYVLENNAQARIEKPMNYSQFVRVTDPDLLKGRDVKN